jgi:hypothetical protein
MQAIADRPSDDAAGKQVDDNGQIQPALAGPDIADIGRRFKSTIPGCSLRLSLTNH